MVDIVEIMRHGFWNIMDGKYLQGSLLAIVSYFTRESEDIVKDLTNRRTL